MIKPMYLLLLLISCSMHAQPVQPVAGKPQPLPMRTLPVGSVLATGWLKTAIDRNLNGFTGWLDSLAPALVVHDDIYAANRIKPGVTSKDLGAVSDGGDWQVQFLWWNSETQGNWLDGLLRGAIVTRHRQGLQKAEAMVQHILQSQDTNGYIGIYDTTLRYRFDNENGELWSKATILRFLLAWYGYARQPAVLKAVERAVQDVMVHWPAGQSQPFYSVKPDVSGLSHGLMFTDVLLELYQLTGNRQYLDYGVFLYNDFSRHTLHEDAQLGKLLNPALQLQGHGVHTYEHVRAVALS